MSDSGIIFDIKRYAIHDGPGIRTTIFLKGCPVACQWCHNPEGIDPAPFVAYKKERCIRCGICVENCPEKALGLDSEGVIPSGSPCKNCFACTEICPAEAREQVGKSMSTQALLSEIIKDTPFYETSGGGVTFSGGEPLLQVDFLLELLKLCGKEKIHRAVDTTGYTSLEALMRVAEHTDLFLFDLKMMDSEKHKRYTGVSNHLIIDNLRLLAERGGDIVIRIPFIPGINDDLENLERTGSFLNRLPNITKVDILPYHDFQKGKYNHFNMSHGTENVPLPSREVLAEAKSRLEKFGFEVALGG